MSSGIYFIFEPPILLPDWLDFCKEHQIEYSPRTVGQNIFYYCGGDGIQITFGKQNLGGLPRRPDKHLDFDQATPYETATRVTVSTYFMGNLVSVARIARLIKARWPGGECQPDQELEGLMV